ncbi:hypothetical protein SynBIOSU31_01803 [Synechococcus sp. BIOS-U3-1]|nr:hypothetical protein SynBIOSU31_01803 [Synechococcus sp. BIOS-U3-1]
MLPGVRLAEFFNMDPGLCRDLVVHVTILLLETCLQCDGMTSKGLVEAAAPPMRSIRRPAFAF